MGSQGFMQAEDFNAQKIRLDVTVNIDPYDQMLRRNIIS